MENAPELADRLLGEFGSLPAVLASDPDALARVAFGAPQAVDWLRRVRAAMHHALRTDLVSRPVLSDSASLMDYLRYSMAYEKHELVRALFLNAGNYLLRDEVLWRGTITQVAAYPREIVHRCLDLGATAFILVHNHPSGRAEPSEADILLTQAVLRACRVMNLEMHDHIIVTTTGYASLKQRGCL